MFKLFKRKPKQSFVVNSSMGESSIRVNVSTKVKNADIREEMSDGRLMIVIPSKTLPSGIVMNEMKYLDSEIDKGYPSLEGTPAPLGHPKVGDEYIPASDARAYLFNIGGFNRNVVKKDGSVHIEKWIDKAYAEKVAPELITAISEGKPISTSTGLMCDREPVKGKSYKWIARNMRFDHDAILLNETPAAGVEQGVGMMVNGQMVVNSVLDESERDKREALSAILPEHAHLTDYDDTTLIYETYEGGREETHALDYQIIDGVATATEQPYNVKRKTTWERIKTALIPKNPVQVDTMNEEQIKALMTANAEQAKASQDAIAALTGQMEKLGESLTAIKAEQEKTAELAINAQLADKRAVVAKVMGEVVANALTGEALDEAVAKCQSADGVTAGGLNVNKSESKLAGYTR